MLTSNDKTDISPRRSKRLEENPIRFLLYNNDDASSTLDESTDDSMLITEKDRVADSAEESSFELPHPFWHIGIGNFESKCTQDNCPNTREGCYAKGMWGATVGICHDCLMRHIRSFHNTTGRRRMRKADSKDIAPFAKDLYESYTFIHEIRAKKIATLRKPKKTKRSTQKTENAKEPPNKKRKITPETAKVTFMKKAETTKASPNANTSPEEKRLLETHRERQNRIAIAEGGNVEKKTMIQMNVQARKAKIDLLAKMAIVAAQPRTKCEFMEDIVDPVIPYEGNNYLVFKDAVCLTCLKWGLDAQKRKEFLTKGNAPLKNYFSEAVCNGLDYDLKLLRARTKKYFEHPSIKQAFDMKGLCVPTIAMTLLVSQWALRSKRNT